MFNCQLSEKLKLEARTRELGAEKLDLESRMSDLISDKLELEEKYENMVEECARLRNSRQAKNESSSRIREEKKGILNSNHVFWELLKLYYLHYLSDCKCIKFLNQQSYGII